MHQIFDVSRDRSVDLFLAGCMPPWRRWGRRPSSSARERACDCTFAGASPVCAHSRFHTHTHANTETHTLTHSHTHTHLHTPTQHTQAHTTSRARPLASSRKHARPLAATQHACTRPLGCRAKARRFGTCSAAHPRWMRNIGCDDIGLLGGAGLPTGAETSVTVVVSAGGEAASHLLLPIV
jgi:hypothetical protein